MHPRPANGDTTMKTAPAAPLVPRQAPREPLEARYGAIGIPAVAAAVPFIAARKGAARPRTVAEPVSMD